MKYNLFIGRYNPLHRGHRYIIDSYANNGKPVCVAVRDTEISMDDPIGADVRVKMIRTLYKDNPKVEVIKIPDIESVCVGRGVGYALAETPKEIESISGTAIRGGLQDEMVIKQKGGVILITGLPSSGKTTLATELCDQMNKKDKYFAQVIDGDDLRKTISKDLGFSARDRMTQAVRVADLAALLAQSGVWAICSIIMPYKDDRERMKKACQVNGPFYEVYVKCSKKECRHRDPKGLWDKADKGEIDNFTGVDAPYEKPTKPDLIVDSEATVVYQEAQAVLRLIET